MVDGQCPFAEQIAGVHTYAHGFLDRVGFCDHAAGGFYSTMVQASFWNQAGVSTHFAIARDGRIAQMVNIFDTAFAQGRLGPRVIWPKYNEMQQVNPNNYLISTEHEDWELVNGIARAVPNSAWTPQQYNADLALKKWCIEEVSKVTGKDLMKFGIESLTGHFMFDGVNRVNCPGKYWENTARWSIFDDLFKPSNGDDELEGDCMYIVSKRQTGDDDWYKSYLVRGKEFLHIPNAETFDSMAKLNLPYYEPEKLSWDFMAKDVQFKEFTD